METAEVDGAEESEDEQLRDEKKTSDDCLNGDSMRDDASTSDDSVCACLKFLKRILMVCLQYLNALL